MAPYEEVVRPAEAQALYPVTLQRAHERQPGYQWHEAPWAAQLLVNREVVVDPQSALFPEPRAVETASSLALVNAVDNRPSGVLARFDEGAFAGAELFYLPSDAHVRYITPMQRACSIKKRAM